MPDVDPTHYRLNDLKLRWQQDPSSRLFLQLADEHRKLGQHPEAVAVLEQGLEHRPNDLSALVALGRCRLELEKVSEAIEPLETVVSRDPTHIVASKLLIEAHLQQGDTEKAAERLRTYRLLNDRDPELAHLEYRLKRLQEEDEYETPTVAGGELPGGPGEDGDVEEPGEDGDVEEPGEASPESSEPELPEPGWSEPELSEPELQESEPELELPEPEPEPESSEPESFEPESSEPVPVPAPSEPEPARAAASAADLFQLPRDSPPSPDLGALWEQLPEPEPAPPDPFLGLVSLDSGRHWEILSEEGIFAFPGALAGNGGDAAVSPTEAPSVESELAKPLSTETAARPATLVSEPVAEADSIELEAEAVEPVDRVTESVVEPESIDLEAEAAEPAAEEQRPEDTGAADLPIAGIVGAGVAAGAAALAGVSEARASTSESELASEAAGERATTEAMEDRDEEAPVELDAPEEPAVEEPPTSGLIAAEPEPAEGPAAEPESAKESPTATLGELYLKQGHQEEAKKIFRQVLEQDPDNRLALENLARLDPRRSTPLTAADLLAVRTAGGRIPEGLTAKKVLVLGNYSKQLRAAARRRPGMGADGI